jgi:hypothetical protein
VPNKPNSFGQSVPVSHPISFGPSAPVSQPISFGQSVPVSQPISFGQSVPVSHPISFGQSAPNKPNSFGQSVPVSHPISFGQSAPVQLIQSAPTISFMPITRPISFDYDSGRRHHCNYEHMSGAEYLLLNDLGLSIDYCEKLQRELQAKMNLQ